MLKLLRRLILLLLLLSLLAAGVIYWLATATIPLKQTPLEFNIAKGSSLRVAAQQVNEAGVEISPLFLVALGRLMGVDAKIKAGSYEITDGITPTDLLQKLTRGDVTQVEVAFIEGWNLRQVREKLDAHPYLQHDTKGLSEAELLKRLGVAAQSAEGLFFPDTYLFAKNTSDLHVLERAYRTMQRHLDQEWQNKATNLPYRNPYQALIMASIIEKETGREADRTLVASVFVNRLRIGMLLQTDPSVIYGLGASFDGNLRKRDLQTDTPYNTYTRAGLPPGPIAMPGLASLRAALNPAQSDALYFVARGDGTSQFSRTLDAHNQAVNKYQRGGKH